MAEKTDLQYEICGVVVNCRAVAIIMNNNKILFQKRKQDEFWALPGGKIAVLEKGKETVKRELSEEIGVDVEVSELLDVEENFFNFNGKDFHEFIFMYLTSLNDNTRLEKINEFNGVEEKKNLVFKWFDKEEITEDNIRPAFLNEKLIRMLEENKQIRKRVR